jgi:hypothetical protein
MLQGHDSRADAEAVIATARTAGIAINSDDSLAISAPPALARAFHFGCLDTRDSSGTPVLQTGRAVFDALRYGPIGLFGIETAAGGGRHAVALHGIIYEYDGDLDAASGVTVWGVDPRRGVPINMDFWQLQSQFRIEYILYHKS